MKKEYLYYFLSFVMGILWAIPLILGSLMILFYSYTGKWITAIVFGSIDYLYFTLVYDKFLIKYKEIERKLFSNKLNGDRSKR